MSRLAVHARVFGSRLKLLVVRMLDRVGFRERRTDGMVSVVIPALESRVDLLEARCLPSIVAQTYAPLEIVIVSESFSPEIAELARRHGSGCRYFWGTKKSRALKNAGALAIWFSGAVPNLNLAMKKSRGEYLARLDDDDEWLPNHLEDAVSFLNQGNFDFVSSKAHSPDGGHVANNHLDDLHYYGNQYEWLKLDAVVGPPITWVYRRYMRAFKFNVNSWRKEINRPADYDYMFTIAAAGASMGFADSFSARQCERPGSAGLTGSGAFLAENNPLPD